MIKRAVSLACREDDRRADWVTAKCKNRNRLSGNGDSGNTKFVMTMILSAIKRFTDGANTVEESADGGSGRLIDYIHFNPAARVGTKTCSLCWTTKVYSSKFLIV